MAATERSKPVATARALGRVVLAACALPGVLAVPPAVADEAPEHAVVEFTLSGYQEGQDSSASTSANGASAKGRSTALSATQAGGHATISSASGGGGGGFGGFSLTSGLVSRIHATTPSLYLLMPLGRRWSVEGSALLDQVSGASPAYYTDTTSFAHFHDRRQAFDTKLTRYFDRASLALGASTSHEAAYDSNALSTEARVSTDDQNTTLNVGLGLTRDTINPTNHIVSHAHKSTDEFQLGLTQALSPLDLVQVGWTHRVESGYLDDPYKSWDHRPGRRTANIAQLRWNHWLGGVALRTGYRWVSDSFGVRSHTVDVALAWPLNDDQTTVFTPDLRWYTQSAARFYVPYNPAEPNYPTPLDTSGYTSLDQRLSSFGAITAGARLDWAIGSDWSMNTRFDVYRQDAGLRLVGKGSGGLAGLTGFIWQVGLRHTF